MPDRFKTISDYKRELHELREARDTLAKQRDDLREQVEELRAERVGQQGVRQVAHVARLGPAHARHVLARALAAVGRDGRDAPRRVGPRRARPFK